MMDLNATATRETTRSINVAFTPEKLATLIQRGSLHVADFNCLDDNAKTSVWQMLFASAAMPHLSAAE